MRTLALQKLDDFLVIIAFRVMLVKLDDEGLHFLLFVYGR
jgi:hypothetical protein